MKLNIVIEMDMPEPHNNDRNRAAIVMEKAREAMTPLLLMLAQAIVKRIGVSVHDCYVEDVDLSQEEDQEIIEAEEAEMDEVRAGQAADEQADYNQRIADMG